MKRDGFTLVELAVAIVIILLLSTLASSRIDYVANLRAQSDVRRMLQVWELIYHEALSNGEAHRLVVDLDSQSYYVRREIRQLPGEVQDVDLLANLRTQGEQKRRAEEAAEDIESVEEAFAAEDSRQAQDLETLFFLTHFGDPEGSTRLGLPLLSPSLGEKQGFPFEVRIRDVVTERGKQQDGIISLRVAPPGASEFAVIHFEINEQAIITAMLNPWTGEAEVVEGDVEFEWTLNRDDQAAS